MKLCEKYLGVTIMEPKIDQDILLKIAKAALRCYCAETFGQLCDRLEVDLKPVLSILTEDQLQYLSDEDTLNANV